MYSIMVLMTDGEINDLPETKDTIVQLSYLPCSLIIVGIGEKTDWNKFERFVKGGGSIKNSDGQHGMRDILEFVPFGKVRHGLSDEVLKKVPLEFMTYMEARSIRPMPVQYDYSENQMPQQTLL